jgi:hypothetical protein
MSAEAPSNLINRIGNNMPPKWLTETVVGLAFIGGGVAVGAARPETVKGQDANPAGFNAVENAKAGAVFSQEKVDQACAPFYTYQQQPDIPPPDQFYRADQNCTVANFKSNPDNKDLQFAGPYSAGMADMLHAARSQTAYDRVTNVSFKLLGNRRSGTRKAMKYVISGLEARSDVTVAYFNHEEDGPAAPASDVIQHSYSGDLFDPNKAISVTTQRRATTGLRLSRLAKPVQYMLRGRHKPLSIDHPVDGVDSSLKFALSGTLRFKAVRDIIRKSGRLYANVSNRGVAARVKSYSYRVMGKNKYGEFERPIGNNIITPK